MRVSHSCIILESIIVYRFLQNALRECVRNLQTDNKFSCSQSFAVSSSFTSTENRIMMRRFFIFLCTLHLGTLVSSSSDPKGPIVWTRDLTLNDKFTVRFNNEDEDKLVMEISAPTTGYVAIGFSPNGGMRGSDIVMAWVDGEGKAHIKVLFPLTT